MTISLAIDTSTSRAIVGIIEDGNLRFEKFHDGATDHGRALSQLVAEALLVSAPPQQVVVGMGPGPFTGLRVGISFARTFGLARNIPVIGVCSLDAIAIDQNEYTVAVDARRKEIYWAQYRGGVRIAGPEVCAPLELAKFSHLPIFGEGALKYKLTSDTEHLFPDLTSFPKLAELSKFDEPLYLRHPDAVPTAERR